MCFCSLYRGGRGREGTFQYTLQKEGGCGKHRPTSRYPYLLQVLDHDSLTLQFSNDKGLHQFQQHPVCYSAFVIFQTIPKKRRQIRVGTIGKMRTTQRFLKFFCFFQVLKSLLAVIATLCIQESKQVCCQIAPLLGPPHPLDSVLVTSTAEC